MHLWCTNDTYSHLHLHSDANGKAQTSKIAGPVLKASPAAPAKDSPANKDDAKTETKSPKIFTPSKHVNKDGNATHNVSTPGGSVVVEKGQKMNMAAVSKHPHTRCTIHSLSRCILNAFWMK